MIQKNIIAQIGHPILRKKTKEVNTNNLTSIKTKKIIKNLIKVMREVNGAGLAANQIYYDLRICVLEIKNNDTGEIKTMKFKQAERLLLTGEWSINS